MLALLPAIALAAIAPLRLSDLLTQARQRNPTLRAATLRARADAQEISAAGTLPNPTLEVELWNQPVDFSSVPVMVQLGETFPLGGKLGLRREVAKARAGSARARASASGLDVATQVKQAYFDLFLAERTKAVDARLATTLEGLRKAALSRISTGQGSQLEVLRIESAQLHVEAEEAVADQNARIARAKLAALVHRSPSELRGPTTTPRLLPSLPAEAELRARALKTRPELSAMAHQIDAANATASLARAQKVPDLGVMLGEMHGFGQPGVSDFLFAGVKIDLPIFAGSKEDPRIDAATSRAEAAQAEQSALADRIAARVSVAYAKVQSQAHLVRLHHRLIPIARQAMETATSEYVAGRGDYLTVLDAVLAWQRHGLELARELTAYEQALAALEHAVGANLGLVAASEGGSDAHM